MINRLTQKLNRIGLILIFIIPVLNTCAQEYPLNNVVSGYPYWGAYHKTPISEIQCPEWIEKDAIIEGWDWSLPKTVKPSAQSYLCIARNFGLSIRKIEELPEVNFKANPVISHWVKWRELEPKEGEINFQPLIENIKSASKKASLES